MAFNSSRAKRDGPPTSNLKQRASALGRWETTVDPRYIFPFEKLEVWQLTVALAEMVLDELGELPSGRHFRLAAQMEAAVASVSQNIAEGKGRQHTKEFIQYLHIAQGSLYEVVTLNEIFRRKGLFQEASAQEIRSRCEQIDRKLNGLINSLQGQARGGAGGAA